MPPSTRIPAAAPDAARRRLLQGLGASPVLAAPLAAPRPAHAVLKTSARIVIAGGGLGGLAIANRLSSLLDGARITVVDAKQEHHYQPGLTLVATGVWPVDRVLGRNADYLPPGVDWVQEMVAGFEPGARQVLTASGRRLSYDFLVVATGTHLDYAQIEGMDLAAIGREGLASVYAGPQAAAASWTALQAYVRQGGEALMTLAGTPLKCAGAPLKMTFMVRDRLRQAGMDGRARVRFVSAIGNVFGVPVVHGNVVDRWRALDIGVDYWQRLVAVDIGARRATFEAPDGSRTERGYDFLHVVPPMRAPDAVKSSELAWQDGPLAGGGWLEVDRDTLQHRRFPEVFGIGDVNGTPRGKTAATVKKSAPIVARNLVEAIAGRTPTARFDGYTSCPLITREGAAMLIEFDYEGRLTPSLPVIEPLESSYFAWVMKHHMLQPAYRAVLRGRV